MARKNPNGIDPRYLDKEKAALRRTYRKSVFFNKKELAAINLYCKNRLLLLPVHRIYSSKELLTTFKEHMLHAV